MAAAARSAERWLMWDVERAPWINDLSTRERESRATGTGSLEGGENWLAHVAPEHISTCH